MTSSRDEDSADAPDLATKRTTNSQPASGSNHDVSFGVEPALQGSHSGVHAMASTKDSGRSEAPAHVKASTQDSRRDAPVSVMASTQHSRSGDSPSHVMTSTRHSPTSGEVFPARRAGRQPNPTAHEVDSLSRWLADFDEALPRASLPTTTPLIVTPLGLPDREVLRVSLRALGVAPLEVRLLGAWARCSTALQVTRRTREALRCAVTFEQVWTALAPDGLAEVWELSLASARTVARHKPTLRAHLRNLEVDADGALPRRVQLHAFHLADEDDFLAAGRRLTVGTLLARRYG